MKIEDKILEIHKRRKFLNFWEAFDYLKNASYPEIEALMISSQLFEGKIWDGVITASKAQGNAKIGYFSSGATISISASGATSIGTLFGCDPVAPDDLIVEIYYMTNNANKAFIPLYKSYIETRQYSPIGQFETHIKSIKIHLTTELGMHLFNDGYTKF